VKIAGHEYRLYTYSYLDFGLEKMQRRFQRLLADIIQKEGDPCYPLLFADNTKGSYARCANLIATMLSKDNCTCTCSFNGIFQPPIHEESFFAIENFWYTTQFYEVSNKDFAIQLKDRGTEFCSTPWPELVKKFSTHNMMDLEKYCFSAAYIPTVLEYGFGFQPAQLQKNLEAVQKVAGIPIDWALGAVLLVLVGNTTESNLTAVARILPMTTITTYEPTTQVAGLYFKEMMVMVAIIFLAFAFGVRSRHMSFLLDGRNYLFRSCSRHTSREI